MRGWWWLWTCCPGLGNARMADLRRLCCEQAIGPDQLWGWPIERLGQALAWPAHCLRDVERYRFEHGAAPKLDVPACALLPGDPDWPRCLDDVHSPPSGLYVEGDRSLLRHIHPLGESDAVPRVGGSGGCPPLVLSGQQCPASGWCDCLDSPSGSARFHWRGPVEVRGVTRQASAVDGGHWLRGDL